MRHCRLPDQLLADAVLWSARSKDECRLHSDTGVYRKDRCLWIPGATLTRPRAGFGSCVLEPGFRKKRLGECSLFTSNVHLSPAIFYVSVSYFSHPHPGFTSHCSAHLFPPGLTLSSTFCFLITLYQHHSWPYPRPPWSFLRYIFSASAPTAICLIISIFLLKNPRSDFSWWLPQTNIGFLYDPAIPLLGVFPKDLKVGT